MTAIKPTDSELREKIDADSYNNTLNEINHHDHPKDP